MHGNHTNSIPMMKTYQVTVLVLCLSVTVTPSLGWFNTFCRNCNWGGSITYGMAGGSVIGGGYGTGGGFGIGGGYGNFGGGYGIGGGYGGIGGGSIYGMGRGYGIGGQCQCRRRCWWGESTVGRCRCGKGCKLFICCRRGKFYG